MGHSRGGLTTKIHALVDVEGRPIHLLLTAGQADDAPARRELLARLAPGDILLADKAYDTDAIRAGTAERGSCPASHDPQAHFRLQSVALFDPGL